MSESFLSEICNNIHDKNECLPLLRCGKSDGTRKQAANIPRAVTALSQSDPFRYRMFILCGCMGHSPSGMSAPSWRTFSSYCSSLHLLCYFPHLLSLSMFPPPLSCVFLPFLKYRGATVLAAGLSCTLEPAHRGHPAAIHCQHLMTCTREQMSLGLLLVVFLKGWVPRILKHLRYWKTVSIWPCSFEEVENNSSAESQVWQKTKKCKAQYWYCWWS